MGVAMQGLSKIFRAPIIKIIGYRAHRAVIFAIALHLVTCVITDKKRCDRDNAVWCSSWVVILYQVFFVHKNLFIKSLINIFESIKLRVTVLEFFLDEIALLRTI